MSESWVEVFDSLSDAQVVDRLRELERGSRLIEIERSGLVDQVRSRGPHWVPPTWIDREQVPRRNKLHDY